MSTNFSPGDKIIDSRDVIERQEELQSEYDSLVEAVADAKQAIEDHAKEPWTDEDDYKNTLEQLQTELEDAEYRLECFDKDELDDINNLVEEAEGSPDWKYGETLIHDDYFTEYIEELVRDCFEVPKEFESGSWPWNHMTMDWDGAADEAKQDYMEVDYAGETYWVRA